jgi:hypothetical protein
LVTIRLDDLKRLSHVVQESEGDTAVAPTPLPGDHAGGG